MIGRTNAGCGLGKSTLIVQTETGSVVTVSRGTETRIAMERYGVWAFPALSAGDWTVRAEKDGKTAAKTVAMDGTSSLTLVLYYNQIPEFTYTGDCEIVDDNDNPITTTTGNWKIRFLTTGILTFTDLRGAENGIDVFLVGGGAAGGRSDSYRAGGGGGYTATVKNKTVSANTAYEIVIGAGGTVIGDKMTSSNPEVKESGGGQTSAFNEKAGGGYKAYKEAYVPGGSTTSETRARGGDGGSGGGEYNTDGAADGYDAPHGKGQRSVPGPNGETGSTREFGEEAGALYASGGIKSAESSIPNTGNGGNFGYTSTAVPGACGIVVIRNHREEAA